MNGPDIYKYGDGDGELLFRLYCVESDDAMDKLTPDALFYGDSTLQNPSLHDVEVFIDNELGFTCDVVVCSVIKTCSDPNCSEVQFNNGSCVWKVT